MLKTSFSSHNMLESMQPRTHRNAAWGTHTRQTTVHAYTTTQTHTHAHRLGLLFVRATFKAFTSGRPPWKVVASFLLSGLKVIPGAAAVIGAAVDSELKQVRLKKIISHIIYVLS